jgi:erythromycin esterase-like protein
MTDKKSFADWVRDHATAADSLDSRAPLHDLQPVREMIGDARIVAIGENAHYVREFYLPRHCLLRFLAEHCGFTVYALAVPFTEAHAIDAWSQGGPGTVGEGRRRHGLQPEALPGDARSTGADARAQPHRDPAAAVRCVAA